MKIGLAFKYKIGLMDAMKVNEGQITSSPSFTPNAFKPKCIAEVPLVVKAQHSDLVNFAILSSNLSKNFPDEDIKVESNDSNNSFRSSLEKFGSDNGINLDIVLTHIF